MASAAWNATRTRAVMWRIPADFSLSGTFTGGDWEYSLALTTDVTVSDDSDLSVKSATAESSTNHEASDNGLQSSNYYTPTADFNYELLP